MKRTHTHTHKTQSISASVAGSPRLHFHLSGSIRVRVLFCSTIISICNAQCARIHHRTSPQQLRTAAIRHTADGDRTEPMKNVLSWLILFNDFLNFFFSTLLSKTRLSVRCSYTSHSYTSLDAGQTDCSVA